MGQRDLMDHGILMYQLLTLNQAQVSNQNHSLIPEGSFDGVRSRSLAAERSDQRREKRFERIMEHENIPIR